MTKHFFIERRPMDFDLGLYLTVRSGDGRYGIALPLQMKMLTDTETMDAAQTASPLVSLRKDEAQQLMDELWRAGLQPSEGSGSAGSLAATERHLADMRALVFKLPTK